MLRGANAIVLPAASECLPPLSECIALVLHGGERGINEGSRFYFKLLIIKNVSGLPFLST